MTTPKIRKPAYWPVAIVVISVIMMLASSNIESFSLQTKVGFVGKIGLIVGLISLWLFTVLPKRGR